MPAFTVFYMMIGGLAMSAVDYAVNLVLSTILIVGTYQFYFFTQRHPLREAKVLHSPIDEKIPFVAWWSWIYSFLYYPAILYLNWLMADSRQFVMTACKKKVIAETGAGQHGVATAAAAAKFGMQCDIYMGALDVERQRLNVFRMEMLGATVHAAEEGERTLKEAVDAAFEAWINNIEDTFYVLGSAVGPHPKACCC